MSLSFDNTVVLRNTYRWIPRMLTVTVSPKYQVVIPKDIRDAMEIRPGQKIHIMMFRGQILLVPILPMEQLRGMAKGIENSFEREPDRL